jgi:hypothetical protein
MQLVGLIIAGLWVAAVAWFGWTSLPQLPLDVSAADPGTVAALNAARTRHALLFGAIAIVPAVLVVWLGRGSAR